MSDVKFNGGGYYKASNQSLDVGTRDFVVTMIPKKDGTVEFAEIEAIERAKFKALGLPSRLMGKEKVYESTNSAVFELPDGTIVTIPEPRGL